MGGFAGWRGLRVVARRRSLALTLLACWASSLDAPSPCRAASPYIMLGPADEIALDQPRVAIELVDPATGRSLGPSLANTFLLDTGANSILASNEAVSELKPKGYRTEGTFLEQGVAGFKEFDVSAEYHIRFAGGDGLPLTLPDSRILSSGTQSFCPLPGVCSFYGIMGMPAMTDRVTTLDLTSLGGGMDIGDILNGDFSINFLDTRFSPSLPATNLRRYTVPIRGLSFPAEADGPVPVWTNLPQVALFAGHEGRRTRANFVLDTGAQLSIISTDVAFALGLDANGDGRLEDDAVGSQPIGGVGGTLDAPIMQFEELRIPTNEGLEMVYKNLQVAVVDIDPTIDGILGMNLLSSGWSGAIFGSLGDLSDLLNEAGFGDLLAGLGGLGVDGGGSPYGFFQKVHFDFRDFSRTNRGNIVFDLSPEVSGPLSADGRHGDLDLDGDVDLEDRGLWVHVKMQTWFGDSNLDGRFDSQDLVTVFAAGQYEDALVDNSKWETGDWNGDCEFNSQDMILAFQDGAYASLPATAAVPEPGSWALAVASAIAMGAMRRRGVRRTGE
jgi:hypothetical protein